MMKQLNWIGPKRGTRMLSDVLLSIYPTRKSGDLLYVRLTKAGPSPLRRVGALLRRICAGVGQR